MCFKMVVTKACPCSIEKTQERKKLIKQEKEGKIDELKYLSRD